jgi:methanogenic corrinoid protein MtbC1/DNA-binding XRE family transcriptional regulator
MDTETIARLRTSYCDAILDGSAERAEKVINGGLAAGIIPSRLYLDVLMPVQIEVGARWHRGDVTIPQEHIATQITLRQMARLRGMLKSRLKLGLKAVVSSVEGDQHFIGAQAVADFLVVDGWEVDFLGADIPSDHLIPYAKARGANLVCISVSLTSLVPTAQKLVAALRALPEPPKILLGGAAFVNHPELVESVGADGFTLDPQEAVTIARQVCGLLNPDNALGIFLRKLGHSVHEYRKLRGMSQQELANSSDLDRAYISAVEHGKQNISIGAIAKLAKALDLSIEELLTGTAY